MRIRKRKVPLPLSFLSPVPLPDPHLTQSPMVQLQLHNNPHQNLPQEDDTAAYFDAQPSDQAPNHPIGGGSDHQNSSDGAEAGEASKVLLQGGEDKGGEGEGEKSNDTRKGSLMGGEIQTVILEQSTSSNQVGRWCEGERAFPLKKRRGSFERRSNEEAIMAKDEKMKPKMNKKCVQQNGNQEEEEDKETKEGVNGGASVRKRNRGGALMEGSRCSRVNGRGWRCCQQTLVGYSLCEHHLGKGRLRSMTSVRSRSKATIAPRKEENSQPLSSPSFSLQEKESKVKVNDEDEDHEHGDGEEKKKPLMIAKKKMKLGMVKARSISSLLGQANNEIITVARE